MSALRHASSTRPANLQEAAVDLEKFLSTFFTDIFPQYAQLPLHIAGESFGGIYIPTYVEHFIKRQKMKARGALSSDITSIILVDAVIDQVASGTIGQYDHFCNPATKDGIKTGGLNHTACRAMEEAIPECNRLNKMCLDTYDPNICQYSNDWCAENLGIWINSDVENGKRNPYDDRKTCEYNPPICENITVSPHAQYLNRPWVKQRLDMQQTFTFSGLDFDLYLLWVQNKQTSLPTTREMSFLLDETDVKVLVLNGNNDIIVNTEGQIRVWDSLPWKKWAPYRLAKFADWYYPKVGGRTSHLVKAGQVKGIVNKLQFLTVEEAGHASPGDQPEAVNFAVDCWVSGRSCNSIPGWQ